MCTDQAHIQRDKVDPIYSLDRSVHPRLSVQEIALHLTWRAVTTASRAGCRATTASHKDPEYKERMCSPFCHETGGMGGT